MRGTSGGERVSGGESCNEVVFLRLGSRVE
jgi:hypothetical protein